MNEELADVFARCFGMELIGLRYFNVYGPRQDPDGPYAAVIPRFFKACLRGGGSGHLRRRRAEPRLHVRGGRRRGQPSGGRGARGGVRPGLQRRRRPPDDGQRAGARGPRGRRRRARAEVRAGRGRATSRHSLADGSLSKRVARLRADRRAAGGPRPGEAPLRRGGAEAAASGATSPQREREGTSAMSAAPEPKAAAERPRS